MEVSDGISRLVPSIQVLRNPHVVVLYDGVGCIKDGRCGPVVLGHDDVCLRPALQELLQICPAPLVDGLVRVTHQEEVPMKTAEGLVDLPVPCVAVLHLVHHHIVHLALPLGPDIREVLKDMQGECYEVLEVERKVLPLADKSALEQLIGLLRAVIVYVL